MLRDFFIVMIHILDDNLNFPCVSSAHVSGILAIGGDLSLERLLSAYKSGVFPWFEDGEPITWWAPSHRMVLFLSELKVSKSMSKILRSKIFEIRINTAFLEVITNCQNTKRSGQSGTWITDQMIEAYYGLFQNGYAMSVEVWQDNRLVGGLYGVDIGRVFCGESMFSLVPNASKVAFIYLVNYLSQKDYRLLDCQVYNPHLASLGAREISRNEFMDILQED